MNAKTSTRLALMGAALVILANCAGGSFGSRGAIGAIGTPEDARKQEALNQGISREERAQLARTFQPLESTRPTLLGDLFRTDKESDVGSSVNRYLWNAALETLSFLPVQTVDPFTGVISTGYGTPPGGGRSYRATVLISDPALDARSLKVSLQSANGGAVGADTVRAVEDAILSRARQLRVRDSRF